MNSLVLLRHGQSLWNEENRFTGWTDIGLTENGVREAIIAVKLMLREDYSFDVAYTSVLKRAIKTLWILLEEMDLMWISIHQNWRLNERHYGALQGLNKTETAQRYGVERVHAWRRSYNIQPPSLNPDDERHLSKDPKYATLQPDEIPLTESLKDTVERLIPYWRQVIAPSVRDGKRVLIVAHGNSIRGLVKHVESISDEDILELNIPTGVLMVYEMNDDLLPIRHFYLQDEVDEEKVRQRENIWKRDLGIVHKFLVRPTPRGALVLGKALSAGVRSLSKAWLSMRWGCCLVWK